MNALFNWMEARERIRLKRLAGEPPPWTDDPILQQYRFTNVMREYDRTSQWIFANLTCPGTLSSDLWITLALARQINLIETLSELVREKLIDHSARWSLGRLASVWECLDQRAKRGEKVWTGAYMIHADSAPSTADLWVSKAHYVTMMVVGQLIDKQPDLSSIEAFTRFLSQYESWGGFMAYEVACDLRWAPGWLKDAPDLKTWANPGPGARRGLNRLAGRALKETVSTAVCIEEMCFLLEAAEAHPFQVKFPRPFELRDIEHSLCEYDKYVRVATGQGRPRQTFTPLLPETREVTRGVGTAI